MSADKKNIGFAVTGSFCTLSKVMKELEKLALLGDEIYPIMSERVWSTDSRFGESKIFKETMQKICGREIIHDICGAEPIGPKHFLDALIIAPCTGNTLSKIANGITDTCVAMAAKANLRNNCPLILAVSTNDGLGANAKNIGVLLNTKNVYFVPFGQDDPKNKSDSLVADMSLISKTYEYASNGIQIEPRIIQK